ncbi:hypothetical protein L484_017377 [Morus notabilis]|uniref:Uncharacterized protein n=1 Tax=Morus notabilis TaxID=981085 RepID=W9R516_9ROSA|nr:hypothetical protein L484_017377 [Morus notabilis]
MLSLQSDWQLLHHVQYQNQPPVPPLIQLASYGDDRWVLLSNVTSDGASSSSVSFKHSQLSDSHAGLFWLQPVQTAIFYFCRLVVLPWVCGFAGTIFLLTPRDMLMALARQKHKSGNYKQALEHNSAIYERNPRRTDNILLFGAIHYQEKKGNIDVAICYYLVAIEVYDLGSWHWGLSTIWLEVTSFRLISSFLAATYADCNFLFLPFGCSSLGLWFCWHHFLATTRESEVEDSEEQDFYVSETEEEKSDEEAEDDIIKDMPGLFGLERSEGISSAKEQPFQKRSGRSFKTWFKEFKGWRLEIESEGPRESKRGLRELRRLENIVINVFSLPNLALLQLAVDLLQFVATDLVPYFRTQPHPPGLEPNFHVLTIISPELSGSLLYRLETASTSPESGVPAQTAAKSPSPALAAPKIVSPAPNVATRDCRSPSDHSPPSNRPFCCGSSRSGAISPRPARLPSSRALESRKPVQIWLGSHSISEESPDPVQIRPELGPSVLQSRVSVQAPPGSLKNV